MGLSYRCRVGGGPGAKLAKGPSEAVLSLPLPAAPGASNMIQEIMPP